ncbi:Integral membrane protein TerC [Cystobacter fuscus DSM 2262]|uniref:Integral membrane protein TerC n=1 Tax=Cystobacter fuscus (strain ATCC 25194 / DSM 2262 / NBRC 100088 / M29) TaxID=1242864 RepID=S9QYC7_CYSF2|nr:TerC family protein [Cystobacter fuscus]EPX61663.1 Integral membrane protein TerC [Cystobacter fuscus DSM 2262]
MNTNVALWVGFNLFVLAMLALDLGVFHRKEHVVSPKEAGLWTVVWIVLSLGFCGILGLTGYWNHEQSLQWVTAYVVEYALSVDNLFVFLMVFAFFQVPLVVQHRVLFWGILGAFIMRAGLIVTGTALVQRFHWLLYIFGAFLIFTAVKMAFSKDEDAAEPEQSLVMRLGRRFLPVARPPEGENDHGNRFFILEDGRRKVTPLFLVLMVVETTDLLFALDSIPAVLGISQDAFIVYTSNVCAILGLRSLFFVVASLMDKFHLLKVGLAIILGFVGTKMVITFFDIHISIGLSLGVIGGVLLGSILASLIWPKAAETHGVPHPSVEPEREDA